MNMSSKPVGMFDSGVGGLCVLHSAVTMLPREKFIYIADKAHMPYGERTYPEIRAAALACAERLYRLGCKAIVVACNTATEVAIEDIRRRFPELIVVGLEPAVKPCYEQLDCGYAVALVTRATERSAKFKKMMTVYGDRIVAVGSAELAKAIEDNDGDISELMPIVERIFKPYADAEAVILGCSHYTYIDGLIRNVLGCKVKIYDGAVGAAARLKYLLEINGIAAAEGERGWIRFYST